MIKKFLKSFLESAGYVVYKQNYLPHGCDLATDLKKVINDPLSPTFFDVGANIGQTATYLLEKFPKAHIECFEMVPSTFSELKDMLGHNAGVRLNQFGLGDKNETIELPLSESSLTNSLLRTKSQIGKAEQVEIKTLDNFMSSANISSIDLLKIDTEGYELQVLKGGAETLGSGQVKSILLECNLQSIGEENLYQTSFYDALSYLSTIDYHLYGLYDQTIRTSNDISYLRFVNALFVWGK